MAKFIDISPAEEIVLRDPENKRELHLSLIHISARDAERRYGVAG